jgi:hypothetical protein
MEMKPPIYNKISSPPNTGKSPWAQGSPAQSLELSLDEIKHAPRRTRGVLRGPRGATNLKDGRGARQTQRHRVSSFWLAPPPPLATPGMCSRRPGSSCSARRSYRRGVPPLHHAAISAPSHFFSHHLQPNRPEGRIGILILFAPPQLHVQPGGHDVEDLQLRLFHRAPPGGVSGSGSAAFAFAFVID